MNNSTIKTRIIDAISNASVIAEDLNEMLECPENDSFISELDHQISDLFDKLGNRIPIKPELISDDLNNSLKLIKKKVQEELILKSVKNKLIQYQELDFESNFEIHQTNNSTLNAICESIKMIGEEMQQNMLDLKQKNIQLQHLSCKLDEKNLTLLNSLDEKDVLLQEIHHRVKNNLQIILGLVKMQMHGSTSNEVNFHLSDTEKRIHVIALIHEKLYQQKNISKIKIVEHTTSISELYSRVHEEKQEVSIHSTINEMVSFSADKAIPYGILLNEAMLNANKQVLDQNKKRKMSIFLTQQDENISLTVHANGCGLSQDSKNKKVLGITLMDLLASQLHAKLIFSNDPELTITLKFKI